MRVNASPESFMIKDKDYSIVSCSPETLIDKKKTNNYTKTTGAGLTNTSNKIGIGASLWNETPSNQFKGGIADPRIWKTDKECSGDSIFDGINHRIK